MKRPYLSIVLPTYTERRNVELLIPQLEKLFKKNKWAAEILVVDDSSPDKTAEAAQKLNRKYNNIRAIVREKKEGIGAALKEGYDKARGEVILSMDAALALDINDIPRLLEKVNQGYDFVIGSKHSQLGVYEANSLAIRIKKLLSYLSTTFARIWLGIPIHDFALNFRAIRKNAWEKLDIREKMNAMLVEMIWQANRKGYKIHEVPVIFKERKYGTSKVKIFEQGPDYALKIFLFGLRNWTTRKKR